MGEYWAEHREDLRAHRAKMLAQADTAGWTQHTPHHFSRVFDGVRVEWWPSGGKAKIGDRMVYGHRKVRRAFERLMAAPAALPQAPDPEAVTARMAMGLVANRAEHLVRQLDGRADVRHGHVTPRVDGIKARCGGPGLCKICQREQAAEELLADWCEASGTIFHETKAEGSRTASMVTNAVRRNDLLQLIRAARDTAEPEAETRQVKMDGPQEVPDGVWEALQRLIENTATMGPASREDAMTIARYRDRVRFLAAWRRPSSAHHPDKGGTAQRMAEINVARDAALRERS